MKKNLNDESCESKTTRTARSDQKRLSSEVWRPVQTGDGWDGALHYEDQPHLSANQANRVQRRPKESRHQYGHKEEHRLVWTANGNRKVRKNLVPRANQSEKFVPDNPERRVHGGQPPSLFNIRKQSSLPPKDLTSLWKRNKRQERTRQHTLPLCLSQGKPWNGLDLHAKARKSCRPSKSSTDRFSRRKQGRTSSSSFGYSKEPLLCSALPPQLGSRTSTHLVTQLVWNIPVFQVGHLK